MKKKIIFYLFSFDFYLLEKNKFFSSYIMMENPCPEEKIIKDIRNLFRLKKRN